MSREYLPYALYLDDEDHGRGCVAALVALTLLVLVALGVLALLWAAALASAGGLLQPLRRWTG